MSVQVTASLLDFGVADISLKLFGSQPQPKIDANTPKGFVPVDPQKIAKVRRVVNDAEVETYWETLTEDQRRVLLPNQTGKIVLGQFDAQGKISYLASSVSASEGDYQLTLDYMKFLTQNIADAAGKPLGRGNVGVALRVVAKVKTKKKNLDLGGLLPLGVAASSGWVSGSLEVQVVGLVSPKLASLITLPLNLDQTSIVKAVESMGAIKVLVDDQQTITVPHLLQLNSDDVAKLIV